MSAPAHLKVVCCGGDLGSRDPVVERERTEKARGHGGAARVLFQVAMVGMDAGLSCQIERHGGAITSAQPLTARSGSWIAPEASYPYALASSTSWILGL
jgi:hypothetical protein